MTTDIPKMVEAVRRAERQAEQARLALIAQRSQSQIISAFEGVKPAVDSCLESFRGFSGAAARAAEAMQAIDFRLPDLSGLSRTEVPRINFGEARDRVEEAPDE